VDRSLRVNVRERVALVVLIDGFRGNASVNDFAKQATYSVSSLSGEWTDIGLTASDRRNHFNDLRLTVMALYVLSMLSGSG
jgi:hypothetical protein